MGLLLSQSLVLLVSQVLLVRTLPVLLESVSDAKPELWTSLQTAVGAVILSIPIVYLTGRLLRSNHGRKVWLLIVGPVIIPASLVGIGLITMWNSILQSGLYGTMAMPVLVAGARFIPFGILAAAAQMISVDEELLEAARLNQRNVIQRILRIDLPLYAPGLLAAAVVVFILTIGELGATLIVSPPGRATLTMRIYNYLHYGASDTVAGLCLVVTLATILVGAASVLLYHYTHRMLRHWETNK